MTPWSNWAGNVHAWPRAIAHPGSTAEIQALVSEAAREQVTIRAVGAGHSFTPIAATDGVGVHLGRMDRVLGHDRRTGRVRVEAGIGLRRLNAQLEALGLALPDVGDVDSQSLAGAISTGTHGTGARLRGICDAVVGVELVTAAGDVLEIGDQHPWLNAVRVGLGAFGILTEITLQCVPAFLLHAREEPVRLSTLTGRFEELVCGNEHAEFYWFPHTDRALLKRNNRVGEASAPQPLSRLRSWFDDDFLSNTVYEAVQRLARRVPSAVPSLNALSGTLLTAREYTDSSHRVFVSPRRVRFTESEFAVPRGTLPSVIKELQDWFADRHEHVSFPIEVRCAAADDAWLSTGHGRDNAYVAVHQYHRVDPQRYFAAAQDIFIAHGGRPHWGKMHTLDAEYFANSYSRFGDFLRVRDEMDPQRRFTNAHLDRVLGR